MEYPLNGYGLWSSVWDIIRNNTNRFHFEYVLCLQNDFSYRTINIIQNIQYYLFKCTYSTVIIYFIDIFAMLLFINVDFKYLSQLFVVYV